jgi:hypothetical protein
MKEIPKWGSCGRVLPHPSPLRSPRRSSAAENRLPYQSGHGSQVLVNCLMIRLPLSTGMTVWLVWSPPSGSVRLALWPEVRWRTVFAVS